jgi:hypothetical protein
VAWYLVLFSGYKPGASCLLHQSGLRAAPTNLLIVSAQGDLAGALKSYRDGLAIREAVCKAGPGQPARQTDVALSVGRAKMVLAKPRGDWTEAGPSLAHGLGILDALEKKNSPSALQKQIRTWLEDLRESA